MKWESPLLSHEHVGSNSMEMLRLPTFHFSIPQADHMFPCFVAQHQMLFRSSWQQPLQDALFAMRQSCTSNYAEVGNPGRCRHGAVWVLTGKTLDTHNYTARVTLDDFEIFWCDIHVGRLVPYSMSAQNFWWVHGLLVLFLSKNDTKGIQPSRPLHFQSTASKTSCIT